MLTETSFARLNEPILTNPEVMTRYAAAKTRRSLAQVTDSRYARGDSPQASPYLGPRLHALAMSGELLARGKSTGHTIQRMFCYWVQAGPGTASFFPWSRSTEASDRYNLLEAVYQSFGEARHIDDWAKVVAHVMTTGPDTALWLPLLLGELVLRRHKKHMFPASLDETRHMLHEYMRPVWNHRDAKPFREEFMKKVDDALLFLQAAFCDTLTYTLEERALGTLASLERDWQERRRNQGLLPSGSQLLSLAVWVTQAVLALVELGRPNSQIVHGDVSLANFVLVKDDREDVDVDHYSVQARGKKTIHLYLPRAHYDSHPCRLVLGNFGRASSSLHGHSGEGDDSLRTSPVAWDLLTFQREWMQSSLAKLVRRAFADADEVLSEDDEPGNDDDATAAPAPGPTTARREPEPSLATRMWRALWGVPNDETPAIVANDKAEEKLAGGEDEEEEENDSAATDRLTTSAPTGIAPPRSLDTDGEEEDEEEEAEVTEEEEEVKVAAGATTPPAAVDVPSANRIVEAFGQGAWRLTENNELVQTQEEPLDPQVSRAKRAGLDVVTPYHVLSRSAEIRTFFHKPPAAGKRVHHYEPKMLFPLPMDQSTLTPHSLTSLWEAHHASR
jgi:hypothetical protein